MAALSQLSPRAGSQLLLSSALLPLNSHALLFFPNSTASIHLGICGKLDWGQILVPLLLAEWPSTNLLLGAGLVEVCGNCTHGFKGNSQLSLFYCSGKFKKEDIKPEVFGSWRGCSLNFLFTAKVHNQFHEKHLKKENLNISILLLLNHCIFIFSFYPFWIIFHSSGMFWFW